MILSQIVTSTAGILSLPAALSRHSLSSLLSHHCCSHSYPKSYPSEVELASPLGLGGEERLEMLDLRGRIRRELWEGQKEARQYHRLQENHFAMPHCGVRLPYISTFITHSPILRTSTLTDPYFPIFCDVWHVRTTASTSTSEARGRRDWSARAARGRARAALDDYNKGARPTGLI